MAYALLSHPTSYSLGTQSVTETGARLTANMPCNFPDPTPITGVQPCPAFSTVSAFRLGSSNLPSKCSYPLSGIPALVLDS